MQFGTIITLIQFFFAVVIGMYFWNLLRSQQGTKLAVRRESRKEMDRLEELRSISLSEPLSELTRPRSFEEVIGQEEGLEALKAALCGPNPQHVIVYGPPGVGKTAAARLVLEYARKNELSPFRADAKFVELDATTARFDERGIADPLIGSVHDPIYQGAGPLGIAGVPQPKPGAVTRAHGGVLFIDEIGELHPIQMNKLLKVLEDRKVFLESAYYNPDDPNTPDHIRDIFEHGLPADFRLVGATTRRPSDLPPAIRSRCVEVFFRLLTPDEVDQIAVNAARRIEKPLEPGATGVIRRYATNGRDAVNIVQIAAGIAMERGVDHIRQQDVEWVINNGQYDPRPAQSPGAAPAVGVAYGLAVYGIHYGAIMEIEATCVPARDQGQGKLRVTGIIDEEEIGERGRTLKRTSMARSSLENVLTVLSKELGIDPGDYHIHINFPGGVPADGPSAGVTLAVALHSAITGVPVRNDVALTGELSIHGRIRPVGGIVAKLRGAAEAGIHTVLIPSENAQDSFSEYDNIEVIAVDTISEVLELALASETGPETTPELVAASTAPN